MKLAIMQPYFFPYLGYFQLINCADTFVIYDNIEFTKKSWIRRNRILNNHHDQQIIVPVKRASDYSLVCDLKIAETYDYEKILRTIKGAYHRAPYFNDVFQLLEGIIPPKNNQLFDYLLWINKKICTYLNIQTEFIISSSISVNHSLKAQEKVIALCKALNVNEYINPIGGQSLYRKSAFAHADIKLSFHVITDVSYKQYNNEFIPNLSIIDVMMFNSLDEIKSLLNNYELS